MKILFKIRADLLAHVRNDLQRPHSFAKERVGFLTAGLASCSNGVLAIARDYHPVADEDYVEDHSVGAMMAPAAIRKAQERALFGGDAIFHVHMHGGRGIPAFSGIDVRENAKFVPDFLKVAPQNIHGAIVLSEDAAFGQCWVDRACEAIPIHGFAEVGIISRKWGNA